MSPAMVNGVPQHGMAQHCNSVIITPGGALQIFTHVVWHATAVLVAMQLNRGELGSMNMIISDRAVDVKSYLQLQTQVPYLVP
jgi:hypothetical protein